MLTAAFRFDGEDSEEVSGGGSHLDGGEVGEGRARFPLPCLRSRRLAWRTSVNSRLLKGRTAVLPLIGASEVGTVAFHGWRARRVRTSAGPRSGR